MKGSEKSRQSLLDGHNESNKEKKQLVRVSLYPAADGPVFCTDLLLYYLYGGNQLHGLEWDVQGNELCRLKELYENAA